MSAYRQGQDVAVWNHVVYRKCLDFLHRYTREQLLQEVAHGLHRASYKYNCVRLFYNLQQCFKHISYNNTCSTPTPEAIYMHQASSIAYHACAVQVCSNAGSMHAWLGPLMFSPDGSEPTH
jgi:hypothetical protein